MVKISEAFSVLIELAEALGVHDINLLPGAWEMKIDDEWTVAVNGHGQSIYAKPDGCQVGFTINPYSAAIWHKGWVIGEIGVVDGVFIVKGAEDRFINAVRSRIERLKKENLIN